MELNLQSAEQTKEYWMQRAEREGEASKGRESGVSKVRKGEASKGREGDASQKEDGASKGREGDASQKEGGLSKGREGSRTFLTCNLCPIYVE